MRLLIFITLAVAVYASLEIDSEKWQAFKLKHARSYKNQVEDRKRFAVFQENLRKIEEHNALYEQGLKSYTLKVTKFADLTHAEFVSILNVRKSSKPNITATEKFKLEVGASIPESIDWRINGSVTEVKDEGDCASSWAFALVGAIEAGYFLETNQLVSLSAQQLVDCSTDVNYGCSGGHLEQTFLFIEKYGLQSDESYPYKGVDETCTYNASAVVTKIFTYYSIHGDEEKLKEAVGTVGPIAAGMDGTYLQFYDKGIYEDDFCVNYSLNRAILIVGYGSESGKDYWIAKNSWGTDWGEEGFFRMVRGANQCGISADNACPIVKSPL